MKIKVISIKQPYADLIMDGIKTLEIRTWKTKYRGRLYIHSCKAPNFSEYLCGYIVGYVDISDIRPFVASDIGESYTEYKPHNYAWVLNNPVKIEPIAAKGRQRIFYINLEKET